LSAGPGPRWQTKLATAIHARAALRDGVAYVGTSGGEFHAIAMTDGRFKWTFAAGRGVFGEALATDDAVYFACDNGYLFKLDRAKGKELWRYDLGDERAAHPAAPARRQQRRLRLGFLATMDNFVYALDRESGQIIWRWQMPDAGSTSSDGGGQYRPHITMLDGISLDQLRTFIAAADEGSFSAAGRRLKRAQSVVSLTLANLEAQLGVKLFDRRARFPVLTDHGRALLADARAVTSLADLFKAQAKSLAGGLEPELSVIADVMLPTSIFTAAVAAFQQQFPSTLLRLDVESSALVEPVLSGRCALGIVGSWSVAPPQLTRERLLAVQLPMVVAPQHPLARHRKPIPMAALSEYIQLVHTDVSDRARGPSSVLSSRMWRLSHLGAKHAFLRAGFGFGSLPLHVVEQDLASGALVQIAIEDALPEDRSVVMSAVYRTDSPPGPAGRWFIDRLKSEDQLQRNRAGRAPKRAASRARRKR